MRAVLDQARMENPGEQEVIILMGLEIDAVGQNLNAVLEEYAEQYPEFNVVSKLTTDYSLPQGLEKAQNALQANRDATVLVSVYADITKGAVPSNAGCRTRRPFSLQYRRETRRLLSSLCRARFRQ